MRSICWCFNPRTPCGVRPSARNRRRSYGGFQSTHSLRSATGKCSYISPQHTVSIHALLAECDCLTPCTLSTYKSFNPRTPCGVRQASFRKGSPLLMFQSTHSLRSATMSTFLPLLSPDVSIHALLAECDRKVLLHLSTTYSFNPRTPCGVRLACPYSYRKNHAGFNPRTPCGVRLYAVVPSASDWMFQSTHSLRSATNGHGHSWRLSPSFNPRTPCGVRPIYYEYELHCSCFNPRTPCGVRRCTHAGRTQNDRFQSTHSLRSATLQLYRIFNRYGSFNPRTPCGVRRMAEKMFLPCMVFQSTHSLRSATISLDPAHPLDIVSIHALLAECDRSP